PFDLSYQVEQHPWSMLAGSCVAGFLVGALLNGRKGAVPRDGYRTTGPQTRADSYIPNSELSLSSLAQEERPEPAPPTRPGWMEHFTDLFEDEIHTVKGLAVGAAIGLLRDVAKNYL